MKGEFYACFVTRIVCSVILPCFILRLLLLLKENARFYEWVYGTGTKEADRANDFITNKNEKLYAKLGNALLKEMREQSKLENQGKARQGQPNWQELIYQDKQTVQPIKANLGKIKKLFVKILRV